MIPSSAGHSIAVLENVHPSQISMVPFSMKTSPATAAGSGAPASTRRNQYMASPAAESLRIEMSVTAVAAGRT